MLDWVTWKAYVGIAIATALIFFLAGRLAGPNITNIILQFESNAVNAGMSRGFSSLFVEPIRISLEGNPIVCIVLGLVWPITLLWLGLFLIVVLYGIIVPGLQTAGTTIS
jgi:hypothetical protein